MSEKDPKDILAIENQQQGTLGRKKQECIPAESPDANGIGLATHCGNQHMTQPDRP